MKKHIDSFSSFLYSISIPIKSTFGTFACFFNQVALSQPAAKYHYLKGKHQLRIAASGKNTRKKSSQFLDILRIIGCFQK